MGCRGGRAGAARHLPQARPYASRNAITHLERFFGVAVGRRDVGRLYPFVCEAHGALRDVADDLVHVDRVYRSMGQQRKQACSHVRSMPGAADKPRAQWRYTRATCQYGAALTEGGVHFVHDEERRWAVVMQGEQHRERGDGTLATYAAR